MTHFEILPATAFDGLKQAWDSLHLESGREPCVSYQWTRAILRNHLAGHADVFIVVIRRAGVIAGLVPMASCREQIFGIPIVSLRPVPELSGTHSDLLFADHDPSLPGAWLDAIASCGSNWDMLRMARLLEHHPLAAALVAELRRRRAVFRWRLEQPSFILRLPDTYPGYLAQRSSKLRNYLGRAERKLASAGIVEFKRVMPEDSFGSCYEDLLAIEKDSWKHAHGTAISAIDRQRGFYRDLAEAALQSGVLHLTFLRVDGVAIAYNLGISAGSCYSYLKTSYRQHYRTHGAASVGRARLIQALIREGHQTLDFPGEPYEWEQQWTDELRWHHSLVLYNDSLAGRAASLAGTLRNLFRRSGERRVVFADSRSNAGA